MSFGTDAPLNGGDAVRRMTNGKSLGSMAYAVGFAASAIVITAGYHIVSEEGRGLLSRLRSQSGMRRERNSVVLCLLLASEEIPVEAIKYLEGQRDVFRAAVKMSLNDDVPEETRKALRRTLQRLHPAPRSHV